MQGENRDGIGATGKKTKLIINYLPQGMSNEDFRQLFAQIGPLQSHRVMRDKQTDYSFGYGFIDYERPEDAIIAISKLNGHKIQNKTLRVAYSKAPGSSKNVNLYVSGIGPQTDEKRLRELFITYGEVIQTKVLRESNGSSKGVGFVLFKEKPEADAAIKALQGYADGYGMNLQIKYAKDSSEQQRSHPKYLEYVHSGSSMQQQPHMPYSTGPYPGMIYGTTLGYSEGSLATGYGGGYAGMDYGISDGLMSIGGQKSMRGRGAGGARYNPIARPIGNTAVGMAMPANGVGYQEPLPVIIFIYNIGPDATESDLYILFSKYGRITKVNVIDGKGYGFVHMPLPNEANEAVRAFDGMYYNGRILQVSIKSAKK